MTTPSKQAELIADSEGRVPICYGCDGAPAVHGTLYCFNCAYGDLDKETELIQAARKCMEIVERANQRPAYTREALAAHQEEALWEITDLLRDLVR